MARVDIIAAGLVEAAKELGDSMTLTVVRLAGTNLAEGERILAESGIEFVRADTFGEAAEKAVAIARRKNIQG
jgi:malate-CoA ligase subunit beta